VLCKHEVVGSIPSGSTRWTITECSIRPVFVSRCCHPDSAMDIVRNLYSPACAQHGSAGYLTSYRGDRSEFGSAEQSAETVRLSPERFRRLIKLQATSQDVAKQDGL
jgi:hypothetical protein